MPESGAEGTIMTPAVSDTNLTSLSNETSMTSTLTFPSTKNISSVHHEGEAAAITAQGGSGAAGPVVAVVVLVVLVATVLVGVYLHRKRKGKPVRISCWKSIKRTRNSSLTSSRRALEDNDEINANVKHVTDLDPDPVEGGEYYYDELFAQSQFQDEATNNAMRRLYSDPDPEVDDMFDLDLEALGIKVDDRTENKHGV